MTFKKETCRECDGTGKMVVESFDGAIIDCVICDGSGTVDVPQLDQVVDKTCPLCGVVHSNYRCRFDERLKDSDGKTFYPQG